jgi:4-amino-4-deoxy-L-arabinose transferase-like glycosyltransferase
MRLSGRVLALLALALALRAGYAVHGHRGGSIPTSSDQYETIALNLLGGHGYAIEPGRPTAQREPVYPLLIAAVYAPFGRVPALVIALQCLLGVGTCWLVYLAARRLFGEDSAVLALALCAVYPQAVYYSAYFFRESLLSFSFAVLFYSSSFWSSREPSVRPILYGAFAALALGLSNSAHLPALALAAAALALCAPRELRWRRLALFSLPLLLGFVLWSARNHAAFGRFIAGSTHGGEEFYQALIVPPEDLGTARQTEILAGDRVFQETLSLPEDARNAALTRASFAWIAEHPGIYAGRAAAGLLKFWKPWPYKRSYNHGYGTLLAASLASDAWLIPLGFWALWRRRRDWAAAPALWAGVIGLTLVYGAVHAVIRYRLPLMAPLCAFAAAELLRLVRSRNGTIRDHG